MTFLPKSFFLKVLLILLTIFLFWWIFPKQNNDLNTVDSLVDHSLTSFYLEGKTFQVEVVNTPQGLSLGLGGRKKIGSDGMLFVYDQPSKPIFWMKGMLIPIDIIWLSEGKIVDIERDVQPPDPGTPDGQLSRYPAPQLVDMVLETNPGFL